MKGIGGPFLYQDLDKQRAIRSYQHSDFECDSEQRIAQTPRPPADWSEQSVNTITSKGLSGHLAADTRPVVGWKVPGRAAQGTVPLTETYCEYGVPISPIGGMRRLQQPVG